jgi:hypothetical protein
MNVIPGTVDPFPNVLITNNSCTFKQQSNSIYKVTKKVSVHLMITIQKVTSSVQSVPRLSPDIY